MQKGKLVVFSAPSGAGKTTIVREIINKNIFDFEFSVSATSRKKRKGETDGKDYYFLSIDEFKKKIKENAFVEWEEVYNNQFYGTLHSEIERIRNQNLHVIFDVDVKGGISIKKQFKNECLTIFILPPSIDELKRRLINRGTETKESLNKRVSKAEYELTFSDQFDVNIINVDLEKAIEDTINEIRTFLEK